MNKAIHQWIFPCKYSIHTNTCSFLHLLRKAFNCYQQLQALTMTNTIYDSLALQFCHSRQDNLFKRMTLIDVLKLSFSAVVLVWTNIVYMVQKKKQIWISKAVPKQETFWTKVFKYLYSREMITCCLFPMNSSKSNIYTHLQWSPREAVLVPEPLHWNCLLQKEKKLQHLCLKTNKILFTWYNFPHG